MPARAAFSSAAATAPRVPRADCGAPGGQVPAPAPRASAQRTTARRAPGAAPARCVFSLRYSTGPMSSGSMKSIRELSLSGRRLFLRVDFNVPLDGGRVADDTRIVETLPTVRLAIERGARVICASHLGKAKGKPKPELSLAPVAVRFAEAARQARAVRRRLRRARRPRSAAEALARGRGAAAREPALPRGRGGQRSRIRPKALASLADVYVDDAFGAAHRAHASVVGVPKLVAEKGAGLLLEKEVRELSRLLEPSVRSSRSSAERRSRARSTRFACCRVARIRS